MRLPTWLVSDPAEFKITVPYRFNPLGAHIDHQGGCVLARTTARHTSLTGHVLSEPRLQLTVVLADGQQESADIAIGSVPDGISRWARYAAAAAHTVAQRHGPLPCGFRASVSGSMIAAGLSSSASYLLAIIEALGLANDLDLDEPAKVDAVREVEHSWFGLANGIQDQLSILHGHSHALTLVDPNAVAATAIDDPVAFTEHASWLLCYSGVSRELANSGYNNPVHDCHAAAALLQPGADRLGDVAPQRRRGIDQLPEALGKRARHVYGEMQRVDEGVAAWQAGDLHGFGALMNASCRSSIDLYESGSEWLIALHEIAVATPGVFGNRFSGGGYGGCLVMLIDKPQSESIAATVLQRYLALYPDRVGQAHCFEAGDAAGIQIDGQRRV